MHVYRSPFPDIDLHDRSITEVAFAGLAGRMEAPALIDGVSGRTVTGAELVNGVQRLAGGLVARGLGTGHVVAIMAPNLPQYALVFHGVAWAGGTITTVNPTYTAEELRYQLKDSGAELLIAIPPFLETARAGAEGTSVTEIVVIGEADDATPLGALMGDPIEAQVPVDPREHVVVLPYSSGTTGLPKGVMLTHRNLVANVAQLGIRAHRAGDASVAVLPFFHIYGMILLMYHMAAGGVTVTLPRFDLETLLRLMQEHRTRMLYAVPPMVLALAKAPVVDNYDLSALESVLSGAAPLGADLEQACAERLGCEVVQGYGMTEMSPVSHATPFGRGVPGSSGPPVASTLCRVVDPETGLDAEPGGRGELWVKGPQVMKGYLGRPDATAEMLVEDGWLRTGDIVRFDESGYLYVVDRVKELIKVKGFQVPPAELEALLVTHPCVADAAVIGVADEEAGERPVAYVVRSVGTSVEGDEICAFVAGHVAHYKQLQRVTFVDAIPKSPSGKILRRILRADA